MISNLAGGVPGVRVKDLKARKCSSKRGVRARKCSSISGGGGCQGRESQGYVEGMGYERNFTKIEDRIEWK